VGDGPITAGYRNDAMRIDTGRASICRADSLAQATGLTLLEQNFESALSAMPSGNGEGMERGGGTASPCGSLAMESGRACSRERSPAATSSASTFTG
jgi:hypothetical protein